jgi:hypothetical protein
VAAFAAHTFNVPLILEIIMILVRLLVALGLDNFKVSSAPLVSR